MYVVANDFVFFKKIKTKKVRQVRRPTVYYL